tara:strand:- start:33175 stop:33786 length:612 start_codon:yes stop_codon:yes gene_type:complete
MGYDVYGLNPKQNTEVPTLVSEFHTVNWEDTTQEQRDEYFKLKGEWEKANPGEYFRANVWYWRPVWNFVCAACDNFLSDKDLDAGCSNSGDRISKTKAKRIASRLRSLDKQGIIQTWEDEMMIPYNKAKEKNKYVDKQLEIFQENMKAKYHDNITPSEYSEKDKKKWDNIYYQRDWASSYPPSRDLIMEFAAFCEESGGFEIC